jgi:hypothetical protein
MPSRSLRTGKLAARCSTLPHPRVSPGTSFPHHVGNNPHACALHCEAFFEGTRTRFNSNRHPPCTPPPPHTPHRRALRPPTHHITPIRALRPRLAAHTVPSHSPGLSPSPSLPLSRSGNSPAGEESESDHGHDHGSDEDDEEIISPGRVYSARSPSMRGGGGAR